MVILTCFNYLPLLLLFIGYCIQAFFNISVIEVAPMFYMALGLCINKDNAKILK